ncbi:glycine zipper 2TM domain-containing protein [Bordetella sp. LUAb4]|uniref:glycine zipper 2TM domain-containing protein n=1 Tax=Bordetella sp. LUAb4 TaxID=2843195 RepID=UPI001E32C2F6|nr:glycine zipper 2TM domain-containing protein [Bordetella sp. LUAb4]
MNTATSRSESRRGLHPLVATAAVSVIVLCGVAVAAIGGWLPSSSGRPDANDPIVSSAADPATLAQNDPANANLAPLPGQTQPQQQGATRPPATTAQANQQPNARTQNVPQNAPQNLPQQGIPQQGVPPAAQNDAARCPQCGTVVSMGQVQVPVQDRSNHVVGTVAGGVVGGVVGNQFGGGGGKTALTVLGAVGGALAGREIERNMNQKTVTRYQLVARTNDGRTHTFRSDTPFQYSPGQAIRVENNQLLPR